MNNMQFSVDEFLSKHLGTDRSGLWPKPTGRYNKWLLIKEEVYELAKALGSPHVLSLDIPEQDQVLTLAQQAEVIKEICDLLYVVFNLCEEMRIDIEPFFDIVHRSNMTKTPAALSPTRKILKGPDYRPPYQEIEETLRRIRSMQASGGVHDEVG